MVRRLVVWIVISCAFSAAACSDRGAVDPGGTSQAITGLVISNPQFPPSNLSVHVGRASVSASNGTVVYVSLAIGTMPDVTTARILNKSNGVELVVPIVDGGFDPVAIAGSAGDELVISFQKSGTGSIELTARVPLRRPPTVVRTNPSKGRTDVAFNVSISVVFSEPIDPTTANATNVQLLKNGVPVDAAVNISGNPFTAVLMPAAPLAPETSYEILVSQGILGLDGEPLETSYTAGFVTTSEARVISLESRVPDNGWVMLGDTVTITAVVKTVSGAAVPPGDSVVWSQSNNRSVLFVRTTKRTANIRVVGETKITIMATIGQDSASVVMNVSPISPFSGREAVIWTESGMVAIPRPDGVVGVNPSAINDRGEVVGDLNFFSNTDGGTYNHAFIWSQSAGMIDIGATMPPSSLSSASGIDANGRVVGSVGYRGGPSRAFRWSREVGVELLDSTLSYQIHAAGDGWIAGTRWPPGGTVLPYRWKPAAPIENLPIANDSNIGQVLAINDAGQAVGYDGFLNGDDQGFTRAVFWDESGSRVELVPCTANMIVCYSQATAINNHGQVVGTYDTPELHTSFRWSRDTGTVLLGESMGRFRAVGITDSGDIVGNTAVGIAGGLQSRALLLRMSGAVVDLGVLPGKLNSGAAASSPNGEVVGASW